MDSCRKLCHGTPMLGMTKVITMVLMKALRLVDLTESVMVAYLVLKMAFS